MIPASGDSVSRRSLKFRCLAFGFSVATLTGTYLYNQGYQLNYECPIRHFTGIPCPSCGMTRSLMAAMRGDWIASVDYHFFGPFLLLVLLVVALGVPLEWLTRRSFFSVKTSAFLNRRFITWFLLILMGYHGSRLIQMHQQGLLMNSFIESPLGRYLFSG